MILPATIESAPGAIGFNSAWLAAKWWLRRSEIAIAFTTERSVNMKHRTVTRNGKQYVVIEDADFAKLADSADVKKLPAFPPVDANGNSPAIEFARVSIARQIITETQGCGALSSGIGPACRDSGRNPKPAGKRKTQRRHIDHEADRRSTQDHQANEEGFRRKDSRHRAGWRCRNRTQLCNANNSHLYPARPGEKQGHSKERKRTRHFVAASVAIPNSHRSARSVFRREKVRYFELTHCPHSNVS